MKKSTQVRFAVRCALAELKQRYMQTPIDKAAEALVLLQQAVTSAQARRKAITDLAAQNEAKVALHEKTITDLTARAVSAENALTALTDKVGALTTTVAGIS